MAAAVAAARATHLVHLAWYTEHGRYWSARENLRWMEASIRLADEFIRAGGRHVLGAGSCAEYDWSAGWCDEDATALAPHGLYGVTKDATRRVLQTVCSGAGVPFCWGRIFYCHGPGENRERLVPSLVAALSGERPPFPVGMDVERDYLHVDDVAVALATLAAQGAEGACNISAGRPVRIRELVQLLARILGADPDPLLAVAARSGSEPMLLAGIPGRLRALGWRPRLSLEAGLRAHLSSASALGSVVPS
jgi:nucleoside-diphosphate-sugar epimerase